MASLKDFFSRPTGSKKVLAFDGGGVRAIAGLIFLQKLEVESGKKISEMFDMFVGVSAGALNALCFGVNEMTAKETKDYWAKEYIDEITSSNFFWDKASIIQARPKYENTGRIEVLKKIFCRLNRLNSNIEYYLILCIKFGFTWLLNAKTTIIPMIIIQIFKNNFFINLINSGSIYF